MANLFTLAADYAAIENLIEENDGELTPETLALLDENTEALAQKAQNIRTVIARMQERSAACAAEIKRLQSLKKTADNAEKNLKGYILAAMQNAGLTKIDGDLCRISLRRSSAVAVDEAAVLAPYAATFERIATELPDWVSVKYEVSKTALRAAIERGDALSGCEVIENMSVIIK